MGLRKKGLGENSDFARELAAFTSGIGERTDSEVRRNLEELSRRERKLTLAILIHLIEAEKRKIHASAGYSSLFDYCTRGLRYSESAAGRRIRAARAVRDYPQVRALLRSGDLSICSISAVAGILTRENHGAILEEIRGKSRREIDRIVAAAKPLSGVRERVKPLNIAKPGSAIDQNDPKKNGQIDLLLSSSEKHPVGSHILNPPIIVGERPVSDRGPSGTLAYRDHGER